MQLYSCIFCKLQEQITFLLGLFEDVSEREDVDEERLKSIVKLMKIYATVPTKVCLE